MAGTICVDPLDRLITLHEATRSRHIVPGHRELAPHRGFVESAITNPTIITRSGSDKDCRLYHGPGPKPMIMMRVVADVVRGFVKTAHLVRRVSATESVEWSSREP